MQLYLTPGACSQADHIALHEAGMEFGIVRVDIPTRTTEDGRDFVRINGKGYVPALAFEDGEVLTENTAILAWIAQQRPQLLPDGPLGFARLIEMLSFVASEIHKPFIRLFFPTTHEDGDAARQAIGNRFEWLERQWSGPYIFGERFTTADAYLFVMVGWALQSDLDVPVPLKAFHARVATRPAVLRTLKAEGFS